MTAGSRRKRRRQHQHAKARNQDSGLRQTTTALTRAVQALTPPQPHPLNPACPLPCRYTQLRQALYTHRGGNGGGSVHTIPAWIDALKYVTELDTLASAMVKRWPPTYCQLTDHNEHHTIRNLNQTLTHHWSPKDDCQQIRYTAHQLTSYSHKIDDLFAPRPAYLPDPCPHCGHTTTHKLNDEGEDIRTPALAVTADRGAWCQQCHDTWTPLFLARILGYPTPPQPTSSA